MTDFQHPAEQGSTAEDFLRPNNAFPMYQYSIFLDANRDEQLVVRASTFEELLAGKRNIQLALKGESPQYETNHSNSQNNGHSYENGHASGGVVCDLHEAQIFTVKKDGPNHGRQFKSCTKCSKFLGFVWVFQVVPKPLRGYNWKFKQTQWVISRPDQSRNHIKTRLGFGWGIHPNIGSLRKDPLRQ